MERRGWEEEARMAGETPSSARVARAAEKATGAGVGVATGDDGEEEDEMLAEQRRWQEEQRGGGGGGGTKVERK